MVGRVFILMALLFFACASSAQLVEVRGKSPYAPVNEPAGGRVRYPLGGPTLNPKARREDAYKKMFDACHGPYSIVREWDQSGDKVTVVYVNTIGTASVSGSGSASGWNATGQSSTSGSATTVTGSEQTRVIDFACEPTADASVP